MNGEVYFNKDLNLTIIVLIALVPKVFRIKFFQELNTFFSNYSFTDVVFISGILPIQQVDQEISSKQFSIYYISNDDKNFIDKVEQRAFQVCLVSFQLQINLCNI